MDSITPPLRIELIKHVEADTAQYAAEAGHAMTADDGVNGDDGLAGAAGANGSTWHSGWGPPSNALGVDSDFYFDNSTADLYKKQWGYWQYQANLRGPRGQDAPATFLEEFWGPMVYVKRRGNFSVGNNVAGIGEILDFGSNAMVGGMCSQRANPWFWMGPEFQEEHLELHPMYDEWNQGTGVIHCHFPGVYHVQAQVCWAQDNVGWREMTITEQTYRSGGYYSEDEIRSQVRVPAVQNGTTMQSISACFSVDGDWQLQWDKATKKFVKVGGWGCGKIRLYLRQNSGGPLDVKGANDAGIIVDGWSRLCVTWLRPQYDAMAGAYGGSPAPEDV